MKTLGGIVLAAALSTQLAQAGGYSNPVPFVNEQGLPDTFYVTTFWSECHVAQDTLPMTFENLFKVDQEKYMILGLGMSHDFYEGYDKGDSAVAENDRPYFGAAKKLYYAKCYNALGLADETGQHIAAAKRYMNMLDPRTPTLDLLDEADQYLAVRNHEKVDEILYSAERQWFVQRQTLGVDDTLIIEERLEIR
jgi:hypothetical protein